MTSNSIDTICYDGTKTIFTEKQWKMKCVKRPELREPDILGRIKSAIEKPSFVYKDLAGSDRLVYYKYEYSVNGRNRYLKVVISIENKPYFVITAYRPDYVKERGKTQLIYGEDSY